MTANMDLIEAKLAGLNLSDELRTYSDPDRVETWSNVTWRGEVLDMSCTTQAVVSLSFAEAVRAMTNATAST